MIDLKLENKRVVVIGGSNGIGLQIVNKFLQQGSDYLNGAVIPADGGRTAW